MMKRTVKRDNNSFHNKEYGEPSMFPGQETLLGQREFRKRNGMLKVFLSFCFLLIAIFSYSQQLEVLVSGNINFDNSSYAISEAGNDYQASIETQSSIFVTIDYTFWLYNYYWPQGKKWSISVNKADVLWDPQLKLEIRRTGNGSSVYWNNKNNKVNIRDGMEFQTISDTPMYFFHGKDAVYDIPIAFKVSGASVTMGAKQFETNIILTVTDSW